MSGTNASANGRIPNALTVNKLATLFGLDRRSISRRLAGVEPVRVQGRSKFYDLRMAAGALFLGTTSDGELLDPRQEHAALDRARRAVIELELTAQKRGWMQREDVETAWGDAILRMRSRLLSVPTRAAVTIHDGMAPGEREAVIRTLVYEALEELSAPKATEDWVNERLSAGDA